MGGSNSYKLFRNLCTVLVKVLSTEIPAKHDEINNTLTVSRRNAERTLDRAVYCRSARTIS